jgi:hypothetical protein
VLYEKKERNIYESSQVRGLSGCICLFR